MKNKKTLIILTITFVVLIAGASVLYNFLGERIERQSLVAQEPNRAGTDADTAGENTDGSGTDADTAGENAGGSGTDADAAGENTGGAGTDADAAGENTGGSQEGATDESLSQAPDFTVVDKDGNQVLLSDLVGKPVILNFWASWCGPCKSEMPDFDDAFLEYAEEINFMMVNLTDGYRETVDSATEYVEDAGYSFPIYYDTESDAALTYGVYSVPTTYFIDSEGYLVAYAQGAISRDILQQGIDMIYSESSN